MTYRVDFTPQAFEDLSRLDTVITKRITAKIQWLSEHGAQTQPETLTGRFAGLYKLRVGDWRVLYTTDTANFAMTVHVIAHRSSVYKM